MKNMIIKNCDLCYLETWCETKPAADIDISDFNHFL